MKTIVSAFFYLWVTTNAYPLQESQQCLDKFVQLDKNCYYFSNGTSGIKNWTDAERFCSDRNSNLVSIESIEELSNIHSYFLTNNLTQGWYWTSGSNMKKQDQYIWMAVNNPLSINWCKSYPPPSKDGKICVMLPLYTANEIFDQCLVHDPCDRKFEFICEFNLNPVTNKPTSSISTNLYKNVNIYVDRWFLNSIM